MPKYELVFEGEGTANYFPRYRRQHRTIQSAHETATKVYEKLEAIGNRLNCGVAACHQGIIYGPGLGNSGIAAQRLPVKVEY